MWRRSSVGTAVVYRNEKNYKDRVNMLHIRLLFINSSANFGDHHTNKATIILEFLLLFYLLSLDYYCYYQFFYSRLFKLYPIDVVQKKHSPCLSSAQIIRWLLVNTLRYTSIHTACLVVSSKGLLICILLEGLLY